MPRAEAAGAHEDETVSADDSKLRETEGTNRKHDTGMGL